MRDIVPILQYVFILTYLIITFEFRFGRWDVLEDIHKVWFVQDHANVEVTTDPIRVTVSHYHEASPHHLLQQGIRPDAAFGTTPQTASRLLLDVGPTMVGYWTCTPGSFPVAATQQRAEGFHIFEGSMFVTNQMDGSSQKCQAGDTVVLPKGWSGYFDVLETVKKLRVVVE